MRRDAMPVLPCFARKVITDVPLRVHFIRERRRIWPYILARREAISRREPPEEWPLEVLPSSPTSRLGWR